MQIVAGADVMNQPSSSFTDWMDTRSLPRLLSGEPEPDWVRHWRAYYRIDFAQSADGVTQRLGRVEVAGYQLAVQLYRPQRQLQGTCIVLHGYYDHMGLYGHLYAWALQQGFAVLTCDLPGHGLSSGARASIESFAEYQQVLQVLLQLTEPLRLPGPVHLIGQSTGAAIGLELALRGWPGQLGRLVMLAPLVRPRAWRQSRLLYQGLSPFVRQIPRRRSQNSGDEEFLQFLQQDPLQAAVLPTAWVGALSRWIPQIEQAGSVKVSPVIVQGDADRTVDWKHNLDVLQDKFASPEICILPGAQHHLVNELEHYRQQGFHFIEKHL